ncbi:MAG: SMP-30/gluconolactonase/LRE family protein [Massilibacteroides sp.]|nr:SMP-30/gluconolactonase/LRE family protein [Massilibacteroides sp.]MDD3063358.1 SMP-30/gluconolactonase/LRE family protein [Massilibacteroides sp.]MDD4114219.1 SMP-30/gluconolactonase/LRE family protein [Massilibacteroides sp.]MDD4661172.1 SMP-30/gluconolactonase/LRE family protein [Massilibacteroides sp.]
MNRQIVSLGFLFFLLFVPMACAWGQVTAPGAKVEKLAGNFSFTEGPTVDRLGNVYFTDQPNNLILKWSVDGVLTTFTTNSGRANGLYFDRSGNLLSCSDMDNEIWSFDPQGNTSVLVDGYNGTKLNGPNDLWVAPDGGVYFTDPLYKREYWLRDPAMQQDGEHVYYLSPDRKVLRRVASDLEKPNGIIGTPDGKFLYVADIKGGKTYMYAISSDGSLCDKRLFVEMGSDGMTIDTEGNVYLTGKGVTVFNKKGELIEHIPVVADWTANVCFGGKDMRTLFITASQNFYQIRMRVGGVVNSDI